MLAIGQPCLIAGLVLQLQTDGMISSVNSAATTAENASLSVDWIRGIYWPVPYVLWVGITLTVLAGAVGVVALLDPKC